MGKKKRKLFFIGSLIVGILLFFFIYTSFDLTNFIKKIWSPLLILYIFITLITFILLVLKWKFILRAEGYKISFLDLVSYRIAGFAVSYITPGRVGGEPVRAWLLKKHKIPFSKALSLVVIDRSIEVSLSVFFTIIAFLILFFKYTLPNNYFFIIIMLVLSFFFFFFFYYRMFKGNDFFTPIFKFLRIIRKIKYEIKLKLFERNIINFFQFHKKEFNRIIIISLLWWVLMLIEYKLALYILGINLGWIPVFLIICAIGLAAVIPIPAALGILEGFQIFLFKLFSLGAASGVALSLLIRINETFWTLIGLLLLSYYGIRIKLFANEKHK